MFLDLKLNLMMSLKSSHGPPFFWCSGPTESVLFLNVSSSDHDPTESEFYSSTTNPFRLINRKQDFNYGVIPFKGSSPASPPCSELRMALIYSLCISYLLFIFWYSVCTYSSERCYGEEIRERWNVCFLFEPRRAGLVKHFALLWYLSLSFFLCWFLPDGRTGRRSLSEICWAL